MLPPSTHTSSPVFLGALLGEKPQVKKLKAVHVLVNALAYIFSASDVTPKQALHNAL